MKAVVIGRGKYITKWTRRLAFLVFTVIISAVVLFGYVMYQTCDHVIIEFDIHQNKDIIFSSNFGQPPQFAIWLEDPVTGRVQTVFVTYRSATGDWVGKFECPVALPRWFEVYQQEESTTKLPSLDRPAPIAVTGATPEEDYFKIRVEVEPGRRWICWIEVNLAGDFNAAYPPLYNEAQGTLDEHFNGQPALVYRGEIHAVVGEQIEPQLYGLSTTENLTEDAAQQLIGGVTTAKNIFKSIKIRVIQPSNFTFIEKIELKKAKN